VFWAILNKPAMMEKRKARLGKGDFVTFLAPFSGLFWGGVANYQKIG
jgi:hypothetical protein